MYCDSLHHWLYGKLCDIEATEDQINDFYHGWKNLFNNYKVKTCKSKKYNFKILHLKNKKLLFDFLEYYHRIKEKIDAGTNDDIIKYCKYIEKIFKIYKEIIQKHKFHGYREEINYFQSIFLPENEELIYLNNKCPDKCLHLVFNKKYEKLCPTDEDKVISVKEGPKSCENSPTLSILKDSIGIDEYVRYFS
ncbi:Plasmodium vivax Vir protein, putative [Plasmodium vivax]|uniref:Vir protein, putative n=1 Tax=Plasmodium vivax TaxID=5855 RepID=A0A1G4E7B1_PLAVI|nr:Plasmodium vivax Vir protein, putative [Plasmodium vivax]